ncbi:MAG TPA: AraC family transcriptional regulator [Caulobacteraceae bacterium]|nr:AraC family transcriptional regulator [Caulobacteraceae bacterium]
MDDAVICSREAAADPLERARGFALANPCETLSLETLAAVAGLSPYHFARAFTARFGVSPMAFARERRMELAARRLTAPAPPTLVDLAFDLGFESQEGFTRAFKRAHGVSPGRYRRDHPALKETPAMSVLAAPSSLVMEPAPVRKPGFRFAGVSGVFSEADKAGIPALWPRLIQRLPLPGQRGDDISFGVCWGEGPGGGFHYMAAVPIADDAPVPAGLEVKEVAAQSYLVFRQATDGSDLHPQMQAAAREIWGVRLPKSGFRLANAPDLEAYPPHFYPDRPDSVEWWIPVEV